MSDLGAIFHVKKDGVQYDAHAYTTLDECPYPNLKVNFRGQQGYVKLENNGSGDIPCYVKEMNGSVFQVMKSALSHGSINLDFDAYGDAYFTIPNGIKVIKAESPRHEATYIGVTPNISYHFRRRRSPNDFDYCVLVCGDHDVVWQDGYDKRGRFPLSWSSEINNHTLNVQDYH